MIYRSNTIIITILKLVEDASPKVCICDPQFKWVGELQRGEVMMVLLFTLVIRPRVSNDNYRDIHHKYRVICMSVYSDTGVYCFLNYLFALNSRVAVIIMMH